MELLQVHISGGRSTVSLLCFFAAISLDVSTCVHFGVLLSCCFLFESNKTASYSEVRKSERERERDESKGVEAQPRHSEISKNTSTDVMR